jgi:hypothetical protein
LGCSKDNGSNVVGLEQNGVFSLAKDDPLPLPRPIPYQIDRVKGDPPDTIVIFSRSQVVTYPFRTLAGRPDEIEIYLHDWQIDSGQIIQISFDLKPSIDQSTYVLFKGYNTTTWDFLVYLDITHDLGGRLYHNVNWITPVSSKQVVGNWTVGNWSTIKFKIAGPLPNIIAASNPGQISNWGQLFIGVNPSSNWIDYQGQIRNIKIVKLVKY